jgi:ribonuclease E
VRELTLKSTAPTLVYEEGSLIKRSIRDLYNKDIDEILVAGEDAYREAKDFMRMLMPSHAKNVKPYRDKQPIFARSGIEAQLDAMFSPQVTLRSGGYIVINQTEALVSIDVNSGRATREHNIEDTAHQTNLEASDEIARQLRLRDLAGLIVIDFIDMEEKRNNRSVERKLKDALKNDRARIQVGRISHFGLLEMSRQRIRTGVLESTTTSCPVCQGTGHIRAPSSVALHVLRSLEDQLLRGVTHHLTVRTRTQVALYILNQKRAHLSELELRFGLRITVAADESIANGSHFQIERGEPVEPREALPVSSVQPDSVAVVEEEEELEIAEAPEEEPEEREAPEGREARAERQERGDREEGGRKRRRRRRRRGGEGAGLGRGRPETVAARDEEGEPRDEEEEIRGGEERGQRADAEGDGQRKRRRGRRGGRRGRRGRAGEDRPVAPENGQRQPASSFGAAAFEYVDPYEIDTTPVMEPRPQREARETPAEERRDSPPPAPSSRHAEEQAGAEPAPSPMPERAKEREPAAEEIVRGAPPAPPEEDDPNRPKRSGWWQRRSFF